MIPHKVNLNIGPVGEGISRSPGRLQNGIQWPLESGCWACRSLSQHPIFRAYSDSQRISSSHSLTLRRCLGHLALLEYRAELDMSGVRVMLTHVDREQYHVVSTVIARFSHDNTCYNVSGLFCIHLTSNVNG
jgi:hypothetical protein